MTADSARSPLGRRARRPVAAVAVVALSCLAPTPPASAQGGPPPAAVRIAPVRVESVGEQRMVTGELRAVHRAAVASNEDGRVIELPVREGEPVAAGAVLARLDDRRLRHEHARALADVAVARAVVAERQATRDLRARDLAAVEESFRRDAAKAKELRDAETEHAIAIARLGAAERGVEAAEATADLFATRLADTVIVAPFPGIVIERRTDVGEWLGEGDVVVELVALDPIEAFLAVPQEHLAGVRTRTQPLPLRITASGEERRAEWWHIVPDVDPRARRFLLVAPIRNDDASLVPGLSVVGWVPTGDVSDRLTVPKDAILRNDAGPFVYTIVPDREGRMFHAVPVPVDLRFPVGDRWVIEAPALRGSERVVIEGNERLFPMAPVRIADDGAPETP